MEDKFKNLIIHVETQEQWDYVTEFYNLRWPSNSWEDCKKRTVIRISTETDYYSREFSFYKHNPDFSTYNFITFKQFKQFYDRKILGICGEVYLLSSIDNFKEHDAIFTESELNRRDYKLKEDLPKIKLTIQDIAKLKGVSVEQIQIID